MGNHGVSVIIVSWNSEEYIEQCLHSLNSELDCAYPGSRILNPDVIGRCPSGLPLKSEIILVDNGSQDKTVEIVNKKFPWVHVIKNPYNTGLSQAVNKGAGLANGKYILLLNPDIVVMENAMQGLYLFMEEREDVGACGPRFLWPDGKIQRSCRELPSFKNLFLEFSGIGRIKKCSTWKMWYFNHRETKEVDQPMGSCLMVRRKVFNEVGGMNERYPIFMNDVDLCYRIKRAGYKIFFLADANVLHYLGSSTRKVRRKMILEEHRSLYRYLREHFNNRFLLALYGFLLLSCAFYRILFSRAKF